MSQMANSLALWPPPRTGACASAASAAARESARPRAVDAREICGREQRRSLKRSEIGAGSDKCFLTPCEKRRGVCLEKDPGRGPVRHEDRMEERVEKRGQRGEGKGERGEGTGEGGEGRREMGGQASGPCANRAFNVARGNVIARVPP